MATTIIQNPAPPGESPTATVPLLLVESQFGETALMTPAQFRDFNGMGWYLLVEVPTPPSLAGRFVPRGALSAWPVHVAAGVDRARSGQAGARALADDPTSALPRELALCGAAYWGAVADAARRMAGGEQLVDDAVRMPVAGPEDDCDYEDHEHVYVGTAVLRPSCKRPQPCGCMQGPPSTALDAYGDAVGRLDLAAAGVAATAVRTAAEEADLRYELVEQYHGAHGDAHGDEGQVAEAIAAIRTADLPGLRVLTDGSYSHLLDVDVDRRLVTVTDVDSVVLEVRPGSWPLWRMGISGAQSVHLAPAALDALVEQLVLRADDDVAAGDGSGESLGRLVRLLIAWCSRYGGDPDVIAAQHHLRTASATAAAALAAVPAPSTAGRVA